MTEELHRKPGPLVLIHGWGMHSSVWSGLPQAFAENNRIHCIDLPGHGGADYRHDPATLDGWAKDCLQRAPRRAVWIGWSLGGLVSMAAALHQPERVSALVLICSTPRFVRNADWPAGMHQETLGRFHTELLAAPEKTLDQFLSLQVRGSDAARNTLRALRRDLATRPLPAAAALADGLDLLSGVDLRGRLGTLQCPTFWLFGAKDTLVPAAAAPGIAELLPEARIEVIDGAGHAPFLSHPAQTLAPLEQFIAENPA